MGFASAPSACVWAFSMAVSLVFAAFTAVLAWATAARSKGSVVLRAFPAALALSTADARAVSSSWRHVFGMHFGSHLAVAVAASRSTPKAMEAGRDMCGTAVGVGKGGFCTAVLQKNVRDGTYTAAAVGIPSSIDYSCS